MSVVANIWENEQYNPKNRKKGTTVGKMNNNKNERHHPKVHYP